MAAAAEARLAAEKTAKQQEEIEKATHREAAEAVRQRAASSSIIIRGDFHASKGINI